MISARMEWRKGWGTVLAAVCGMMTASSMPTTVGLVMAPVSAEFGWSRAAISSSIFILSLCVLVMSPVAGAAIGRYGPRPVALISFAATALGFVLISVSGPAMWTWFAAWTIFGLLSSSLGPIVWSSAVSSIFDRSRGLALSTALSGSGLAQVVWPLLLVPVMGHFGWRGVYIMLAGATLFVMLPISWLTLSGGTASTPAGHAPGDKTPASVAGPSFAEAIRTIIFWRLAIAFVIVAGVNGSLLIHFFPMLREKGISANEAAFVLASVGLAMIIGRLLTGYLLDRFFAPVVSATVAILAIVTSLLLWLSPGATLPSLLAAIAIGCSVGGTTCALAYLVGRYFGLRDYATIFGVLIGTYGIGFALVPVITGHVFDLFGTYRPLFAVFIGLSATASLMIATLGPYRADTLGPTQLARDSRSA